jgi:hypothetical protein
VDEQEDERDHKPDHRNGERKTGEDRLHGLETAYKGRRTVRSHLLWESGSCAPKGSSRVSHLAATSPASEPLY